MPNPGESPGDSPSGRTTTIAVLGTLAAGFAVRILWAMSSAVINTDGPVFLAIAQGFLGGNGSAATHAGFHPLYPALVALAGGGETGAIAVSAIAGSAAGWPLWRLMKDLAGPRAAFLSLIVYEFHPSFVEVQSAIYADGIFMLFAAMAASGAIRFARGGGGSWTAAIGAGLAFLSKSEGLIVVLLTLATLILGAVRNRGSGLKVAGAALVMVAIAAPYVGHLTSQAGRLRYSPKAIVEMAVGQAGNGEGSRGKWQDRRAQHGPLVTSVWYTAHSTAGAAGPVHLVLLGFAAITWRWWRTRLAGSGWLLLWVAFYIACVGWTNFRIGHQVSERYVHPPVALLLLSLGAFGAWALEKKGEVRAWPARLATVGVLVYAVAPLYGGLWRDQVVYRDAGEWILKSHGPGAVVCSPVDKVPYYARGKVMRFQVEPPAGADFWVFTEKDAEKWGWNWRAADLGPFKHRLTLPERPDKDARIVHVLERTR